MTFAFAGGPTVMTWGQNTAGQQVWRARDASRVAEFVAPRDTPVHDLYNLAVDALNP